MLRAQYNGSGIINFDVAAGRYFTLGNMSTNNSITIGHDAVKIIAEPGFPGRDEQRGRDADRPEEMGVVGQLFRFRNPGGIFVFAHFMQSACADCAENQNADSGEHENYKRGLHPGQLVRIARDNECLAREDDGRDDGKPADHAEQTETGQHEHFDQKERDAHHEEDDFEPTDGPAEEMAPEKQGETNDCEEGADPDPRCFEFRPKPRDPEKKEQHGHAR